MRKVTITRFETSPEGTFSRVVTDNGFQCYGLEKPWRGNEQEVSCIPSGTYECSVGESPKFGKVYGVKAVPNRTDILIHAANWERQLLGCIALGRAEGVVLGIRGIMGSKDAVAGFMADMENEPFMLTIAWEPHLDPEKKA